MRLESLRNLWMHMDKKTFTYEHSISDFKGRSFQPKLATSLLEVAQHAGTVKKGGKWTALGGTIELLQRYALMNHTHGTIEVHKNLIARRGLGLPKGW